MTAVPMTAVAVGTTSVLRLELRACYCDSRVRLRELHQSVAGQDASRRLAADTPRRCQGARVSDASQGGGSQIACTPADRPRKTMSSCDDRGDETNSICGTKRYVWEANFDRRSGPPPKRTVPNEAAWTVDSGWNAPVSSAVGIPVGRLRCRAMLSNRE